MSTFLEFVLRQYPAVGNFEHSTGAISRFFEPPPNLLLSEACTLRTTTVLDWIWIASCTRVEERTEGWSLTNYLRSDPYYYRWQFTKSLYVAAKRGGLMIVKWLLAHFSGCEAPANVVEVAERCGHLRVLRFLWEHRSGSQRESGRENNCTVEFDDRYDGEYWGQTLIHNAIENGQLDQCLNEGMVLHYYDRIIAVKHALRLGTIEFAERLLPPGSSIVHYAADCPRPEMITKMLDEGYLHWSEERATTALKNCAGSGNLELMQQICQLHSPLRKEQTDWKNTWRNSLKAACSNGNLSVLMWLMEHPLGQDELKKDPAPWRPLRVILLDNAAENGHVRVMQYLYDQGLATDTIHMDFIRKYHVDSVKWLTAHDLIGDPLSFSCAIATAARYGRLDILQLFQVLDNHGGYEAVGLKRRRIGLAFSLWGGERDTFYWAAQGGHVHELEWLLINYPAKCGKESWTPQLVMDIWKL